MLFERLTEDELKIIDMMRRGFNDDGDRDTMIRGEFVDNETFLRFWNTNKAPMAKAFGDGLIIKKPVVATMEDDELYSKISKIFWTPEYIKVRDAIYELVAENNPNTWASYGPRVTLKEIFNYRLFDNTAWVRNRYEGETCEIKLCEGNVMKLSTGCKTMKAIGRMAKACGEDIADAFEVLRLRQSQVLNEARIAANLCISIHPLDYMTASYNRNDWRSCMCWDGGEYRRGVVEMMNSTMVVVAYVESKSQNLTWWQDETVLKWNSKKWREFFIVRPDMITGIKGYPYWNRQLEDEALTWLREIFAPVFNVAYTNSIKEWTIGEPVTIPEMDIQCSSINMSCGPAMYNDFYDENLYHAVFSKNMNKNNLYIDYSGESECVVCGKSADDEFDCEGSLVCVDCITHYTCDKCGDVIYHTSDVYEVNGRCYCPSCYENLIACDMCENIFDPDEDEVFRFCVCWDEYNADHPYTDDVLRTHPSDFDIAHNIRYNNNCLRIFHVCADCAEKLFKDGVEEFETAHNRHREWYHDYMAIPVSHLTEQAIKYLLYPEDFEYFSSLHNE